MAFWAAAAAVGGGLLSSMSGSKAAKASAKGQSEALRATQQATEQARAAAIPLFDASQRNALAGFQGALDIQGQFAPAQIDAFQQGNMQAQNTMRGGLDPQIAAILGGNVDLSGLQAQQVQTPDPSMFQQQLPEFMTIADALPEMANKYIPANIAQQMGPIQDWMSAQANAQANPPRYSGDDAWRNAQSPGFEHNPLGNMFPWMQPQPDPVTEMGGTPQVSWGGPQFLGGG